MSTLSLLVVPMKRTYKVDIVNPLKNIINGLNNEIHHNAVNHSEAIIQFSKLRNLATATPAKGADTLKVLYDYFDQICALEKRIPADELSIPFTWRDAFEKNAFRNRAGLSVASLSFEKICILFNIAALQCAIAASQNPRNDDLKLAVQLLQQSAGVFAYLKDITATVVAKPTKDLNPQTLQVIADIMLAQAQEIFVHKAIEQRMKCTSVAKLACKCEEMYGRALQGIKDSSLRPVWKRHWTARVSAKQAGFQAITQLYQSLTCRENAQFGEEIARLQLAVDGFRVAKGGLSQSDWIVKLADKAQCKLKTSIDENKLIYNMVVPDAATLTAPRPTRLANYIMFIAPLSTKPRDLFVNVLPVVLQRAIAAGNNQTAQLINEQITRLGENTQMFTAILSSLNLPISAPMLPKSIFDNAKNVRENGGIDALRELINALPKLVKRNQQILVKCNRMLVEQSQSHRTPAKLTGRIQTNIRNFRTIINNAIKVDETICEIFAKHSRGMKILSQSDAAIIKACSNATGSNGDNMIHTLVQTANELKIAREVIETKLKTFKIDLREPLAGALTKGRQINEPSFVQQFITQAISSLREQVDESIRQQETLVHDIQAAYQALQRQTGGDGAREAFLSKLVNAYDWFLILHKRVKEGSLFYDNLTQILLSFENKIFHILGNDTTNM